MPCFKKSECNTSHIKLIMFKNNGSTASVLWSKVHSYDFMITDPYPYPAIFDGQGNLLYEEATADTSYIHSYKVNSGSENWATKLFDLDLRTPTILYGDGKVIATYLDDNTWGMVNSSAVMDASNGNIVKRNSNIIQNDNQILLTGDNSHIVFNRLLNSKPTLQEYGVSGNLVKSIDFSFFSSSIHSMKDCKINSRGDILFIGGDGVVCYKAGVKPPKSGTWCTNRGSNGNTNSIN